MYWYTAQHVYSATCRVKLKSAKVLRIRREERQVILCKWKERLSESSKGEWTRLLICHLDAWLERGHGQTSFYLTQVMSSHGAFNAYLFRMKLVGSPACSNCDRRGRDDDAWHTLFECPAFWLHWEDAMTTLQEIGEQPLTPDSLVLIMLKSTDGWDQVAAFVALTMHRKMEIAREWQRRPSRRHPAPNAGPRHPSCLPSATQQWKQKKTIQVGLLRRHPAANLPPKPRILNKGRV